MPVPTPINLNSVTPAPPSPRSRVYWQDDAENPRNVSGYVLVGGVNAQTANVYAIVASDQGKLVSIANAEAVAVSLPSAATLPGGFWLMAENTGAGTVTITPTTSTIDGAASLALSTNQGIVVYSDGTNYFTMRGIGESGGGLNGVSVKTSDYNALSGDNGKLLVMNSASPHTITLPSPPPFATWAIFIQNINTGILTVDRNALTIDEASTNLMLYKNQGLVIFTDGTNYFTERGVDLSRGTAAFTTGSIATNGYETGSVAVGKSSLLYKVLVDDKCRLRLYSTAAGRNADVGRPIGTQAEWNVGLLAELVLDLTDLFSFLMQPPAILENMDATPVATIYYTLNNMVGASHVFTVTLTRAVLE